MLAMKQTSANKAYFKTQISLETGQTPSLHEEKYCAHSEAIQFCPLRGHARNKQLFHAAAAPKLKLSH